MNPEIKKLEEKKLVGQSLKMSITENKTGLLWQKFAPRIKEIQNKVPTTDKISMQIYPVDYYMNFNPNNQFTKWAAIEVENFNNIPNGMETFILPEGLYAVFHYKGLSTDPSIYNYIFREWLPKSNYQIDNRPHFEVLGDKYKNNDPNSEEEIWIPVKLLG